jgi:hypothetical protein
MKKSQLRYIIKGEISNLLKEEIGWEKAHNPADAHFFKLISSIIIKDLEWHDTPAFIVDRDFLKINIELMIKDKGIPQELLGVATTLLNDEEGLDMVIDAYKNRGKY